MQMHVCMMIIFGKDKQAYLEVYQNVSGWSQTELDEQLIHMIKLQELSALLRLITIHDLYATVIDLEGPLTISGSNHRKINTDLRVDCSRGWDNFQVAIFREVCLSWPDNFLVSLLQEVCLSTWYNYNKNGM